MYIHPKLRDFDDRLSALFREVDRRLEDRWGSAFVVHPNRPRRGETANPERCLRVVRDGERFKIVGDFSLGEA